MSSALKEGQSMEEARASAHTALLEKTTMFSPKLLMDAGTQPSAFLCHPCLHPVQTLFFGTVCKHVSRVPVPGEVAEILPLLRNLVVWTQY